MKDKKIQEKKIESVQRYTFEIIHYDDGTSTMNRENDGFSVLEMFGITQMLNNDLIGCFKDNFKPVDEINRTSKNSPFIHKPKK